MRSRVLATVRGEAAALAPQPNLTHRRSVATRRVLAYGAGLLSAATLGALAMFAVLGAGHHENPSGVRASGPRAVLHRGAGHAELVVSGMSEPPPGQVYELWTEHAGEAPRPTDALFTVTSAGKATVEVPGGLRGVSDVMVTREPRGGSSVPSGAAVLRVSVPRHS